MVKRRGPLRAEQSVERGPCASVWLTAVCFPVTAHPKVDVGEVREKRERIILFCLHNDAKVDERHLIGGGFTRFFSADFQRESTL